MKKRVKFDRKNILILILCIFSFFLFLVLEYIVSKNSIVNLDLAINSFISNFQSPLLNVIMIFVTNFMSPLALSCLALIPFIYLVYKKRSRDVVLLVASMLFGFLSQFFIKEIVQRIRPENALIATSGFSFPSGHATIAIIFFSLLIYFFKDNVKNKILKTIFVIGCVLFFFLISFSRIYLNTHWFSDVLAGLSLGLFWISFLIIVLKLLLRK